MTTDKKNPTLTALVSVHPPCTCGASRWFECEAACPSREIVAEYDCAPFDGIRSCPEPEAVVRIERRHPGMWLLYAKCGSAYDGHLKTIRREYEKREAAHAPA